MGRVIEEAEVRTLCDTIDTVTSELAGLKELLSENEDFFRMLTLREVDQDTRMNWMRDIFGGKISDETMAFFCILMERKGMYRFGEVLAEGLTLLGTERQGVKGNVYSAVPLGKETINHLEVQTEKLLKKPVVLVNLIDESLVGGVLISVDGKLIDASLKKRMEDLKLKLRSRTEGGNPL